ncbi:Acetyl esterase/lipase [Flavobacteriaceae bacterium MAR_2010_188]|nr:Acetyl esterase/lipase [Flavobacteriaceae bacterium MAR_2010_188]
MKLNLHIFLSFLTFGLNAQNIETVTYAIKGNDTLGLDVYLPKNIKANEKLPTLLWIHGGGFSGGSRGGGDLVKMAEQFNSQGYAVVSISYRLLRKGTKTQFSCECSREEKIETFKQGVIDYMDAAKYLMQNAEKYHIDRERIIAGGSSAGAEVVLDAVYMREYFIDNLDDYSGVKFAGLFSLAGAMVNADYITAENAVPTVMFHGTEDNLVPFATAPHHYCKPSDKGYLFLDGSSTIAKRLKDLKMSYYFNVVEGGMHEISGIPINNLDQILAFFDRTVKEDNIIQTKVIKTK